MYPSTCPGCGGSAVDTLRSDPTVPVYSCGTPATRSASCWAARQGVRGSRTVELTDLEPADLADLVGTIQELGAAVAYGRTRRSVD